MCYYSICLQYITSWHARADCIQAENEGNVLSLGSHNEMSPKWVLVKMYSFRLTAFECNEQMTSKRRRYLWVASRTSQTNVNGNSTNQVLNTVCIWFTCAYLKFEIISVVNCSLSVCLFLGFEHDEHRLLKTKCIGLCLLAKIQDKISLKCDQKCKFICKTFETIGRSFGSKSLWFIVHLIALNSVFTSKLLVRNSITHNN